MGPEVIFPMPRVNAKIEKIIVRATGSSSEWDISVVSQFHKRNNLLEMTPIIFDHTAEKLGPRSPKIIAKVINIPAFVPKPHKNAQARALPTQESVMATRRGRRSER